MTEHEKFMTFMANETARLRQSGPRGFVLRFNQAPMTARQEAADRAYFQELTR